MEFWIAVVKLLRSPRVMISTTLLALSLMSATLLVVPTTYVASTTMVLTATEFGGTVSQDPDTPLELVNPMLIFNDSLRTSADMLIWSMSSKDVKDAIEGDGDVELTVDDGRTTPELLSFNGPIVYVTARSTDPARARHAVAVASSTMREKLVDWQNDMKAPPSTYITMMDVVAPTDAAAVLGPRLKFAALAFLAGAALGLSVAYAWTRLWASRRSRRPDDGVQADPSEPASDPQPRPVRVVEEERGPKAPAEAGSR
jgi:hypothetical protein